MELLREGDIIELREGHTFYTVLPQHFVYANRIGNFTDTAKTEVTIGRDKGGMKTGSYAGRYVVTKTVSDGGGTGMGPHDVYPNGHHVFCERLSPNKHAYTIKVDFYQTGAFTAMITPKDIQPVGKAKATWSEACAEPAP